VQQHVASMPVAAVAKRGWPELAGPQALLAEVLPGGGYGGGTFYKNPM
jgi:hypothetical protein